MSRCKICSQNIDVTIYHYNDDGWDIIICQTCCNLIENHDLEIQLKIENLKKNKIENIIQSKESCPLCQNYTIIPTGQIYSSGRYQITCYHCQSCNKNVTIKEKS